MRALVLLADGFEDSEFFSPYYRLIEEGFEVDVAGPEVGKVVGKHGYEFETNRSFSGLKDSDYDLLFLPGGRAPETVRLYSEAVKIVKKMMQDGKIVAAICHGPQNLISAGVLHGRRATCWKGIRDDVKAAGAEYVDEEVVVDGNLITSRSPQDIPAFCREMLSAVKQTV